MTFQGFVRFVFSDDPPHPETSRPDLTTPGNRPEKARSGLPDRSVVLLPVVGAEYRAYPVTGHATVYDYVYVYVNVNVL